MKRIILFLSCLLPAICMQASAAGSITIDKTSATASVEAVDVPLGDLIEAARLRTGTSVRGTIPMINVTMTVRDVHLGSLVERILTEAGLTFEREDGSILLRSPAEKTVSLDVVDASVHQLVDSLAEQCGIRNVMIDPDVKMRGGTFRFVGVPCSTALRVVFSTMDLDAAVDSGSVLVVRGR
ncbi:MAG: hypothetical protein R3338_03335 [Thermoanaerobaculia bacterium]|nr:hypothetical protein [Thermoanaerobaculia bacterium]